MIASGAARGKRGLTEWMFGKGATGASLRRPTRDQAVLQLLDLAYVKINKPKPRRLSVIRFRLHGTNVIRNLPACGDSLRRCGGCGGPWPATTDDLLDSGTAVASSASRAAVLLDRLQDA